MSRKWAHFVTIIHLNTTELGTAFPSGRTCTTTLPRSSPRNRCWGRCEPCPRRPTRRRSALTSWRSTHRSSNKNSDHKTKYRVTRGGRRIANARKIAFKWHYCWMIYWILAGFLPRQELLSQEPPYRKTCSCNHVRGFWWPIWPWVICETQLITETRMKKIGVYNYKLLITPLSA